MFAAGEKPTGSRDPFGLFAHRRELVLWGSWGALIALVDLVIIWYGSYLQIHSGATVAYFQSTTKFAKPAASIRV